MTPMASVCWRTCTPEPLSMGVGAGTPCSCAPLAAFRLVPFMPATATPACPGDEVDCKLKKLPKGVDEAPIWFIDSPGVE